MTIYKCPFEQYAVSLDFSADLGAGNTIASLSAVTATNNLTQADSTAEVVAPTPAPTISGTAAIFDVMGGAVGETHTISVRVVSSSGEKYQGDITLRVAG